MNKTKPIQHGLLFLMKVTLVHILFSSFSLAIAAPLDTFSQSVLDKKVTVDIENKQVEEALTIISKIAHVRFTYSPDLFEASRIVSVHRKNVSLAKVLTDFLSPNILFEVADNQISLNLNEDKVTEDNIVPLLPVTGKVTDENGADLPGVNVVVKGATTGTFTEGNGTYTLEVSDKSAILVFSFIGYVTKEITVGDLTVINVTMTPDIQSLSEVIVTSLGIKKESRKVGYAASTVKVDELVQNRTINVMTSLEGKIAGLDIAPPAAGAGASNRIRLRGQAAFNGQTNSPLIVINGLPMTKVHVVLWVVDLP